ncbi:MAG: hypothetical protein WC428_02610 [Candidatus Paceibacterota bacterium]
MALTKPKINDEDAHDLINGVSIRVVARVVDKDGSFCGFTFAHYYHHSEHWVIEGYLGTFVVSHWSSLNQPEN